MKFPIIIHKDPESDYGVTVPDLPGCFSAGSTIEEAIDNAEEAVLTHIEGLLLDNEDVPEPRPIEDLKNECKESDIFWSIVKTDLAKISGKAKRINITMPERILSKIDSFAEKDGETRSGLLASAAMEYIHNHN